MKIVGISGSPNKKNTQFLLEKALEAAKNADSKKIETRLISLREYTINGCIDCGFCRKEFACSQQDGFQELIPVLKDPDIKGIIFGTPVYFGGMSAQLKSLFDRSLIFRRNNYAFKNIVAGAIAVGNSRNGGQELALQQIHTCCLVQDMIIVGDGQPTGHFGGTGVSGIEGGIENDAFGISTVVNLGHRVGEIALKIN